MTVLQRQYEDTLRQNKKLVAALAKLCQLIRNVRDLYPAAGKGCDWIIGTETFTEAESLLRDLREL